MPRPASLDAGAYGSLAFGLGFLFGAVRETVLIPALGPRAGRLTEFAAVTGAVTLLGARLARGWPPDPGRRLARGAAGVAVLLALESTLALAVLRRPASDYLRSLDPRSGSIFPLGLAMMAAAPLLARRA